MSRKQSKPILLKVPHLEAFQNISKVAFNLIIVGWGYFDKDNYDTENPLDSLSYDIDAINIEGGKDNIIDVVKYYCDGWDGSDIEKAVLDECLNIFNLEIKAIDPDPDDLRDLFLSQDY